MSATTTDSLPQLRDRMLARIEALTPFVHEYAQLEQLVAILDGKAPPNGGGAVAPRRRAVPHTEMVLHTLRVAERPLTARELSQSLDLPPRRVQNTLGHLRRNGRVARSDGGWQLPQPPPSLTHEPHEP